MAYDSDLRLRTLEYAKEGHSLTRTAAVSKVNIGSKIGMYSCEIGAICAQTGFWRCGVSSLYAI